MILTPSRQYAYAAAAGLHQRAHIAHETAEGLTKLENLPVMRECLTPEELENLETGVHALEEATKDLLRAKNALEILHARLAESLLPVEEVQA